MNRTAMNLDLKLATLMKCRPGDRIRLVTGEEVEFSQLRRNKFLFNRDGRAYAAPIGLFADLVAKAEVKTIDWAKLPKGTPFYIIKNGNALLYTFESVTTTGKIKGISPATGVLWTIDPAFEFRLVSDLMSNVG